MSLVKAVVKRGVFLVGLAAMTSASADSVLRDVFTGNDGINLDGSAQLSDFIPETVDQLDRVDWIFDADGDPSNGNQLLNPQTSGGLTVTGTTFKEAPDDTEVIAGTWEYTGPGQLDMVTVKFDGFFALYDITGGMTTGSFDMNDFCPDYCNNNGKPFALSHVAAYTVVPVPAAVWLFGSGILGLVGIARRKKAA